MGLNNPPPSQDSQPPELTETNGEAAPIQVGIQETVVKTPEGELLDVNEQGASVADIPEDFDYGAAWKDDIDDETLIFEPSEVKKQVRDLSGKVEENRFLPQDAGELIDETGTQFSTGIIEAFAIAPANLINWGFGEAARGIGRTITGKTDAELIAENQQLYGDFQAELPEELKSKTVYGDVVNTLTQFGSAWTGLGALGKINQGRNWIAGAEAAMAYKGGQLTKQSGALAGTVRTALEGLKLQAKDFAVNTINFDADEGNLANFVYDLAGGNPEGMLEWTRYLRTTDEDGEGLGRLKNAFVSQLGDAAGIAVWNAAKLHKQIRKDWPAIKRALEDGGKGAREAAEAFFQGMQKNIDGFDKAAKEAAKAASVDETLDMLQKGLGDAGETTIIKDSDDAFDAVKKIYNEEKKIGQAKDAATRKAKGVKKKAEATDEEVIKDTVTRIAKTSVRKFNGKIFKENIETKINAGEPINFGEELLDAVPETSLTNAEEFKKRFAEVINLTTDSIKRHVSNKAQKEKMVKMVATQIGRPGGGDYDKLVFQAADDLLNKGYKQANDITKIVTDNLGRQLLAKSYLAPKAARINMAIHQAIIDGDEALVKSLKQDLKPILEQLFATEKIDQLIASESGRLLQSRQIPVDMEDAVDVVKVAKDIWKDYPLLSEANFAGDTEATEMLAKTAAELAEGMDFRWHGEHERLGKLFKGAVKLYNNPKVQFLRNAGGFTKRAWTEMFYNGVLANFETLKTVAFGNMLLKYHDTSATLLGSKVALGKLGVEEKAVIEARAFAKYNMEGVLGSLAALGRGDIMGAKNAFSGTAIGEGIGQRMVKGKVSRFDYSKEGRFRGSSPRVFSEEGLAEAFGGQPDDYAGHIIAKIGNVINAPTHNFMGGVDTVFKVANQRARAEAELFLHAREFKNMDWNDAEQYAVEHVDEVIEDLITARSVDFVDDVAAHLTSKEFGLGELRRLHQNLVDNTDKVALNMSLRNSAYSDRPLFKAGRDWDAFLKGNLGPFGYWLSPFTKTWVNAATYGSELLPGINLLDPHYRAAFTGKAGAEAQANALGKMIMGTSVFMAGAGAAKSGWLSPITPSPDGRSNINQLTGEGLYTMRFGQGDESVTLNFRKGIPMVDGFFLSGKIWQLGEAAAEGTMGYDEMMVGGMMAAGEAFGSAAMIKGVGVSLDSFLNPSYSTPDNLMRNVVISGMAAPLLNPGQRFWDNITRFTDPHYRDYRTPVEYTLSRLPGASNTQSPVYDMFGEGRPRLDYLGDTVPFVGKAVRSLTPIGIRFNTKDALAEEVRRLQQFGHAFTPPNKNVKIEKTTFPLDQYKNDEGKSLWDVYNESFSNAKFSYVGTQSGNTVRKDNLSLREYLSEFIKDDIYQNDMQDTTINKITGKRVKFVGSRWAALSEIYQDAKEGALSQITDDLDNFKNYTNRDGLTITEVIEQVEKIQEDVERE